jgi:hypothetical protein
MEKDFELKDVHSVTIQFDGKTISHATVTLQRPQNHQEFVDFLKKYIEALELPDVEDKELF